MEPTYSTTAQDVVNVYTSVLGCDSTVTTTIVVNPLVTFNESVTICDGETATVNGTDYTTAQDVVNVYTSVLGCDSTVTTTIVVNPLVTFNESVTICDGETATVNGTDYTTAQDVVNVYPSVLGCDSTVTTTIVVNPLVTFNESVTICDGETATVNGTDYTTAQDVVNVYTSVLGCDSTVTTTIVVNPLVTFNESVTICDGETATVNGTDYTTAQDVVNVYPSVLGCDSTVTTTITVIPVVLNTINTSICNGETHTEGTSTYTTSGVYEDVYTSAAGCDSVVTTILTVNLTFDISNEPVICQGETYSEGTSDYNASGNYTDNYLTVNGCDSIITTILTVNPVAVVTNSISICEGETYTEGTSIYNTNGTYTDEYLTVNGCDSTVTTILTVNPEFTATNSITICEGETYSEGTSDYSTSGTYTDDYLSINGCDSTITTLLTVNPILSVTNSVSICQGDVYEEGASDYMTTGSYQDVYTSVQGCDSIVTTELTVNPVYASTNQVAICDGETHIEGTSFYTTTGTYTDVYLTANGCDSIIITVLEVFSVATQTNTITICDGETYIEGISAYVDQGVYTDLYSTVNGCDSIVTTILTVAPVYSVTNSPSICEGGVYEEGTNTYTEPGTFIDVYSSINGCDSTVTTILSVASQFEVTNTVNICEGESYTEGTTVYNTSGTYENTYPSTIGCDSVVTTILAVSEDFEFTNTVSICEGETYIEGTSIYDASGTYTDIYQSILGCDSTIITELTLNPIYSISNDVFICDGDDYTEGASVYSVSGVFTDSYTSSLGCDSVVTTVLTVNPEYSTTNSPTICDSETYTEGASDYTTAGTYTDMYTSINGCDSIITTILTVNPLLDVTNTVEICDGDTYSEGSSVYSASGVFTDAYTSAAGCDSTVTTVLNVNPIYDITNTSSICVGGAYFEGTSEYTEEGVYTDTYTTISGCDSIITTILSVDSQYEVTNNINICAGETYTEGSSIYDATGTYTDLYISTLGCDSIVTTVLSVGETFESTVSVAMCEGETYIEGTSIYNATGTYTDTYQTALGCDSVIITELIVHPEYNTVTDVSICDGDSYFEQASEYTAAGTYTDLYASVDGCDSTVTTVLTVNPVFATTNSPTICEGGTYSEGASDYTDCWNVYRYVRFCEWV